MAKNTINDLRNHIFESIEMVKEGDMDIKTLSAVCNAAQTVANITKLELEMMKLIGNLGTGFIPIEAEEAKVLRKRLLGTSDDPTDSRR